MYFISPFTPLFFSPGKEPFLVGSNCVQVWSPNDTIFIQMIGDDPQEHVPSAILNFYDEDMVKHTTVLVWREWVMNENCIIFWTTVSGMPTGLYSVTIDSESDMFLITDDENLLAQTALVQYSSMSNRTRKDVCFWIDSEQHYFSWRIPGGFKDDGWVFGVDNEQFTDSMFEQTDLYSHEQLMMTLTLGNAVGVPPWYAHLLNMILSCSHVYVDNERYVRSEGSVPEQTVMIETLRSYIYKQVLQKVCWTDPQLEQRTLLQLRRVYLTKTAPASEVYREVTVNNQTKMLKIES